jgi:hypothetical protein
MALIQCTECNKTFSDKAPACPECGCPTDIVLKAALPQKTQKNIAISSLQATETIWAEIRKAKSAASAAEQLFDRRSNSIQAKASRGIDLFGGNATGRVADIAADATTACNDLYTTYQTLVETLDAVCRPLLTYAPEAAAIKAVRDMILFLNEESKIECDFTASLNSSRLGHVASSKYLPSLSNQKIQKFWETTYSTNRHCVEHERQQQKNLALEQAKIQEETESARKHMECIAKNCKQLQDAFAKELSAALAQRKQAIKNELAEHIQQLQQQRANLVQKLQALRPWQIKQKDTTNIEIACIEEKIRLLSDAQTTKKEYDRLDALAEKARDSYGVRIGNYLESRFPYHTGKKPIPKALNRYWENTTYAQQPYPKAPNPSSVFK